MAGVDSQKFYKGKPESFIRYEIVQLKFKAVLKTGQFVFAINMSDDELEYKHGLHLEMYSSNPSNFKMELGDESCDMLLVLVIDPFTSEQFRGQVYGEPNAHGEVSVFNLDRGEFSMCSIDHFHYISKEYLEVPFDAFLCHLHGLLFFEGTDLIHRACEDVAYPINNEVLGVCLGEEDDFPVFQVKDRNGKYLHTALLKYMYENAAGTLPPRGEKSKAGSVAYIKFDGVIYIHMQDSFIWDLEERIGALTDEELQKGKMIDPLLNREDIYLANHDSTYYRCRFIKHIPTPGNSDKKVQVHFIDYGNDSIIRQVNLLSAAKINIHFANLAPLAHQVYLTGIRHIRNIKELRLRLGGKSYIIQVRSRKIRTLPTILLWTKDDDGKLKRCDDLLSKDKCVETVEDSSS